MDKYHEMWLQAKKDIRDKMLECVNDGTINAYLVLSAELCNMDKIEYSIELGMQMEEVKEKEI